MAADADTPDGELSETAATATPPAAPDRTDEGSAGSPDDSGATTDIEPEAAYSDAEERAVDDEVDDDSQDAAPVRRPMSHVRLAIMVGLVTAVASAGTFGWLGYRAHQSHQAQAQRNLFLQAGRQCALNLTTIDYQHADADVQRLLDSATGEFFDQFSHRKQPFIDVVKKAQSKSVGTITEAGLESESGDKAQVLVAVSIKTANLGAPDQPPREWRVHISMEKSGDQVKISNVAFVQ